ncbi:MAG: flagellar biosynthesis anti-sigma factor FlgM [Terracidiphilus sp.]|jgi:flagellar biosynthesis anti-sigma factor FlgM
MDIRSSLDGLKNLLGVSSPAPSTTQSKPVNAESATALTRDSATLSSAANEVALTATDSDVRTEKVTSVQMALAAGTYDVSTSAVASKMVDAMLSDSS